MLRGNVMNEILGYSSINCFCLVYGKCKKATKPINIKRSKDTYKLFYLTDGECSIFVDETKFVLSKHQSFMVFPNQRVIMQPNPEITVSLNWVEFGGNVAMSILSQTTFCREFPVVGEIDIPHFEDYFFIPDSGARSACYRVRAGAAIATLLSFYMEFFPKSASGFNMYVESALDFIEQNFRNVHLSVQQVADHVKIDRTYLYRLFKQEKGMSIVEYINRRRVSRAEVMLIDMQIPVKDVALSVGFSDPMYFSRVFKRLNGMTPTKFKAAKKLRHNNVQ